MRLFGKVDLNELILLPHAFIVSFVFHSSVGYVSRFFSVKLTEDQCWLPESAGTVLIDSMTDSHSWQRVK